MTSFSIVGAGRVGTSLAFALTRKGWALKVIADLDSAAARESRKAIGTGTATADLPRAARGAEVLFICVPDDAVAAVAGKLAGSRRTWTGRIVFHTSGLLPAAALEPLRRRGSAVASLHPIRSFPAKEGRASTFRGIFWGLEGDRRAVGVGRSVVGALGGRALVIGAKDKPLYHAACSLASNAFVSLEAMASALLEDAGIGPKTAAAALIPLVQGTLQNVKKLGPEGALTGPVSRGDVRTVRAHLAALGPYPAQKGIYVSLAMQALRLAPKNRIPAGRLRALRRLLEGRQPPLPAGRRTSRTRVP
jgi:predicted short-subunit dehydrogenase-like oxidoreductase (DUF2520 family)